MLHQQAKHQAHMASWIDMKGEDNNSTVTFSCFSFSQNALSKHNMSYWKGSQYIGVGPGICRIIAGLMHYRTLKGKKSFTFVSVTGAHGRFVPVGEGGVVREARTQTLEPDVWIREVRQRGHGTRRRIKLGHLALWAIALTRYGVFVCSVYLAFFFSKMQPFLQILRPCDIYQSHMSQLAQRNHTKHGKHRVKGHCPCVLLHIGFLWRDIMRLVYSVQLLTVSSL